MEKYWSVDLEFVKAKGTVKYSNYPFSDSHTVYFKRKRFVGFKLSNYLRSEVVEKYTRDYVFECSHRPYEYLEMKRRFIIPSEVVISNIVSHKTYNDRFGIVDMIKVKSDMRYTVDEKEEVLKPCEIIYYYAEAKQPYAYFFDDGFKKVDYELLITYDKESGKYKYYKKYINKEGVHLTDISGIEAKKEIELNYMNVIYEVTPVENVEQVMI